MLKGIISKVGLHGFLNLGCRNLSICAGKPQHLVSTGFHRTGLVDIDMPRLCAQNTLMGTQACINQIGLGAAYQEVYCQAFIPAGLSDQPSGLFTIVILSITGSLFQIGLKELFHDFRMCSFCIITLKISHLFFHTILSFQHLYQVLPHTLYRSNT